MEHDRILKHLKEISFNIKNDKVRLSNIINVLNTGKDHTDINDKLIDTLTNIEFDNPSYAIANEYISILFTNMQTQKITYNKEVTEELLKILNHNLNLLDSVENCVTAMNNKIINSSTNIERRIVDVESKYKRRSTDVEDDDDIPNNKHTFMKFIHDLSPSNKFSNTIFWVVILTIALSIAYIVDKDFYNDTAKTTLTIGKAIKDSNSKGTKYE